MIHLLYVINFLDHGGPSNVLKNLVLSLDQKKYHITILTLVNENRLEVIQDFEKQNIKIISLNYNKNLKSILRNRALITKKINSFGADIVHSHGIVPTFLVANKKIKAKKIATIHNIMHEDYRYTYGTLKGAVFTKAHLKALRHYNKIVCCSESSYNALKTKLKNCTFIRNGVNPATPNKNSRTTIRKKLNLKPTDIIYIYSGNISKLKGSLELTKLFEKYHKTNEYLLLIGNHQLDQKLTNKHIIFIGQKQNIIDYLSASDVYVSNSHTEGFSISIIEALSSGLPLFLRNIPSHQECFNIDKSYYLGETFTPETFPQKLSTLRKNFPTINHDKIRQFQKTHLSAKVMAKKYDNLYEKEVKC